MQISLLSSVTNIWTALSKKKLILKIKFTANKQIYEIMVAQLKPVIAKEHVYVYEEHLGHINKKSVLLRNKNGKVTTQPGKKTIKFFSANDDTTFTYSITVCFPLKRSRI
jgi:hypothetical protein